MAWIHSMWIANTDEAAKRAIMYHFNNCPDLIVDGSTYSITCGLNGMVAAEGDGISDRGINTIEECQLLSLLGFHYFKWLKKAPFFDYALIGVEVDGALEMHELLEDPKWPVPFPGFVINEKLHQQIGSPGYFVPFKEGYLWNPYLGESFYDNRGGVWNFWEECDLPLV